MNISEIEWRLRRLEKHFYLKAPNALELKEIAEELKEKEETYKPVLSEADAQHVFGEVAVMFPPPVSKVDRSGDK